MVVLEATHDRRWAVSYCSDLVSVVSGRSTMRCSTVRLSCPAASSAVQGNKLAGFICTSQRAHHKLGSSANAIMQLMVVAAQSNTAVSAA